MKEKRTVIKPIIETSPNPHPTQLVTRNIFRSVVYELVAKGRPRRALNLLQGKWHKIPTGDHMAAREFERTLRTILDLKNTQEDDTYETEKLGES